MRDRRVKLRKAEVKADFWVDMAKRRGGSEPSRRSRISARKAKHGLARARRLLDGQVIMEALDEA